MSAHGRVWVWTIRVAIAIALLIALVVGVVLTILFTEVGTRFAVERFEAWYDEAIPGALAIDSVDGDLASGVTLSGVRLRDAEDRLLVGVDAALLDLSPSALLRGRVVAERFELHGPTIELWPEASWKDLAPPSRTPPDPALPPGPDLPVQIEAELSLHDLLVLQHGPAGTRALLEHGHVRAELVASGHDATLGLHALHAVVGPADAAIVAGRGLVEWTSPILHLDDIALVSTLGSASRIDAWLDVKSKAWLGHVDAVALPSTVAGSHLIGASILLDASGSEQVAHVSAFARVPGRAALELDGGALLEPVLTVGLYGHGWIRPPETGGPGGPQLGRNDVVLVGGGTWSDDLGDATLGLALDEASLVARITRDGDDMVAIARAELPSTHADATLGWKRGTLTRADGAVSVGEVSRLVDTLDAFIAIPPVARPLSGSLRAAASCRSTRVRTSTRWRCAADLEADALAVKDARVAALAVELDGRAQDDRLRFQATARATGLAARGVVIDAVDLDVGGTPEQLTVDVRASRGRDVFDALGRVDRSRPGELRVALEQLRARAEGQRVSTLGPAELVVTDDAVDVDDLRLAVARGRLHANGRIAWRGRSDFEVSARALDLGVVQAFAPQIDVAGRLDAKISLAGTSRAPLLDADLLGRGLAWNDTRLGALRVVAHAERDMGRVELKWRRDRARARVFAGLPLDLDLHERRVTLGSSGDLLASVDLEQLPLELVQALSPDTAIGGVVNLRLRAAGPLRRPILALTATGSHLRLADLAIGNARLHAAFADDRATARIDLASAMASRVEATASIPLRIDTRRREIVRLPARPHRVAAVVEGFDLSKLRELGLGPELAGIVGGEAYATLEGGEIDARAAFLGRSLEVDDRELGAAQGELRLRDGILRGQAELSGTRARYVRAELELPLDIDRSTGVVRIRPHDPVDARLELRELDLAVLARIMGDPSLAGELSGDLSVDGTLGDPRASLDVEARDLAVRGGDFGRAELQGDYDGHVVRARLDQQVGVESIDARVQVPVDVDLAAGRVQWQRTSPHRLQVVAKGFGLDTLRPFVELPPMDDLHLALRLDARGSADEPHARAQLRAALELEDELPTTVGAMVSIEPTTQLFRVTVDGRGPSSLLVEGKTNASLADALAGTLRAKDVTVMARAEATDFPVSNLAPLLSGPVHDPRGRLDVHATMDGPLTSPHLLGRLHLEDGALTVVPLNQRFDPVTLLVDFNGGDVVVRRLRLESGTGSATAEAVLHIERAQTRGIARLVTKKLPIVRPGLPLMRLDARVTAELDATGAITEIDVSVLDSFVDVLSEKLVGKPEMIPTSHNVTFVDERGARKKQRTTRAARTPWVPAATQIDLTLERPLRIRGAQADMTWGGAVSVRRRPGAPARARGAFRAESGWVELAGNEFEIEQGEIRLPAEGDLDPFVDILATTEVAETEVSVTVRGRVSRPELKLSSSPALPEDQLFALLVTGRADAATDPDSDYAAQAAAVLAAFQNPAIQQTLRDTVGIDRVGLGFGEGVDQPILTVGKRVSRKLYVETMYHHNAPPDENQAEASLEYMFKPPTWSLETFFGDAAEGGISVWWRRRFGSPRDREDTARHDGCNAKRGDPPCSESVRTRAASPSSPPRSSPSPQR